MYSLINLTSSGSWRATHINLIFECMAANLPVYVKWCLNCDIGNSNAYAIIIIKASSILYKCRA